MKPVIASLWVGSDLSWIERVCVQSFLDNGHKFVLYVVGDIQGIPDGVDVRNASEIYYPPPFDIEDNDRLRVAVYSDLFRLMLQKLTNFLWVDLDAYCVKELDFESSFVLAKSKRDTFPNGILGLPPESQTLARMLEFVFSKNPTQPWRGPRLHRINRKRAERGESWGIQNLHWGCSGSLALGFFLKQSGEDRHVLPYTTFYPLAPDEFWKLHHPRVRTDEIETKDVFSVHIYGHQKKIIANDMAGLPRPGSYLERICARHNVDPSQYPVVSLSWFKPAS